jgi:hypothetical protein
VAATSVAAVDVGDAVLHHQDLHQDKPHRRQAATAQAASSNHSSENTTLQHRRTPLALFATPPRQRRVFRRPHR